VYEDEVTPLLKVMDDYDDYYTVPIADRVRETNRCISSQWIFRV
jgi:hypothetical protein